jgi:hypothetical protein
MQNLTDTVYAPTTAEIVPPLKKERILSIDRFRGLCMFFLVLTGFMGIFPQLDVLNVLYSHDAAVGFNVFPGVTLADMFAPYFIFVMGLSAVKSFESYKLKYNSVSRAYWTLFMRYVGLVGFGWTVDGIKETANHITEFAEISAVKQMHIVTAIIALALLVVVLFVPLIKNLKAAKAIKFVFRYWYAFIGAVCMLFAFMDAGAAIGGVDADKLAPWDVLQTIGAAGLFALPFFSLGRNGRLLIASLTTLVIALALNNGALDAFEKILNGGALGMAGWGSIMLFGTVMSDYKENYIRYCILAVLMIVSAIIMTYAFDVVASKRGAIAPYVLITAGSASVIWGVLNLLNNWKPKFAYFTWWGGSAILEYILFLVLSFAFESALPVEDMGLAGAIIVPVVMTALFSLMCWLLYRKHTFVKL